MRYFFVMRVLGSKPDRASLVVTAHQSVREAIDSNNLDRPVSRVTIECGVTDKYPRRRDSRGVCTPRTEPFDEGGQ